LTPTDVLDDHDNDISSSVGFLCLSEDPNSDGAEKIIYPDKGVGTMTPQTLMKVVNAVVLIKVR